MSSERSIGCCHMYNECSDAEKCLNPKFIEVCMYWNLNLSKGRVFYGKNPGIRAKEVYLVVQGRAFKTCKTKKNLSYSMDQPEIKALLELLDSKKITYALDASKYEICIEGTPEKPSQYRLEFSIGEFDYNIRNFNGYELQEDTVRFIKEKLSEQLELRIVRFSAGSSSRTSYQKKKTPEIGGGYYGKETVVVLLDESEEESPDIKGSEVIDISEEEAKTDIREEENIELEGRWDLETITMFGTIIDENFGKKSFGF